MQAAVPPTFCIAPCVSDTVDYLFKPQACSRTPLTPAHHRSPPSQTRSRVLADQVAVAVARAARLRESASLSLASDPSALSLSAESLSLGEDWGADTLAAALALLSTDLGLVSGGLPELGLKEKAAALVAGAVGHHVAAAFGALRGRVAAVLAAVRVRLAESAGHGGGGGVGGGGGGGAEGGALLRRAYAYTSELLARGLEAVLQVDTGGEGGAQLGLFVLKWDAVLQVGCGCLSSSSLDSSMHLEPLRAPYEPGGPAPTPLPILTTQGVHKYEGHGRLLASWHAQFVDTVQVGGQPARAWVCALSLQTSR